MSLKGKVVLVTGAGRGIGRAICLRLAADGATIAAAARTQDELATLRQEIAAQGGECHTIAVDLRDPARAQSLVATALQQAGRLDVLVNNAGIAWCKPITETSFDEWRELQAVNVDAPFLLTREILPVFRGQGGGQIVNIGSDASIRGIGRMTCYCTSKFGLRGMTLALREELRGSGIRLNLILPGPVNTTIISKKDNPALPQPEDIAELVWQVIALPQRADVWELLVEPRS
jgi:3-oxoacyl-[acyl-carrier protein] reductase